MRRSCLVALLSAFLSLFSVVRPASADIDATMIILNHACREFYVCAGEQDTTEACDNQSIPALNIVADMTGFSTISFFAAESTAPTFSCNAFTSALGYHATQRSQITSAGAGTEISNTNTLVSISGVFRKVWVECSSIPSGYVTIRATACSGR